MAYFAELNHEGKVLRVLAVSNNDCPDPAPQNEHLGIAFLESLGLGANWKQTSFHATFRKNYASIGGRYDAMLDAFIPEKLFDSWQLNEATCQWEPPTPYPQDGKKYYWNESLVRWEEITASFIDEQV